MIILWIATGFVIGVVVAVPLTIVALYVWANSSNPRIVWWKKPGR